MHGYEDTIELDGKQVRRVIAPETDPKCGVFVATEYYEGEKMIRRDLHLEVSREAFAAGLISRAGA